MCVCVCVCTDVNHLFIDPLCLMFINSLSYG